MTDGYEQEDKDIIEQKMIKNVYGDLSSNEIYDILGCENIENEE